MHSHTVSLSSPTPGKTVRLLQFNLPHCCSKSWDWITMSITEGTAGADGIGSDGDATLTTSSQPKKRQSAKYCRGLYKNTLSAKSVCFNRASDIYRCFHRENLQVLNDSAVIWQWKKKKEKKKDHSEWVSSCRTARVLLCYSEHHHFNNKVFVFGAAQSPSIVWSRQVGVVGGDGLNHLSLCLPAIAHPVVRERCGGGCIDHSKSSGRKPQSFSSNL